MKRTAKYVMDETIKVFDRELDGLIKAYDAAMNYICSCVPEEMRHFTTGMVMMEARRIATRKEEYDLRRHIQRRDEIVERMLMLQKMKEEVTKI